MGLITYNSLADNTPITANVFNERFGEIIALLNGGLDQTNFSAGGIPPSALSSSVFSKIYPVGSLYFNATDSTDPATLLGFGTWVAFGAGRVPVGYSATDTDFNASEKTGGSKTHTLTTAEMPVHAHGVNDPGHSHSVTLTGSNTETVTNSRAIEWSTPVDAVGVGTSANGSNISIQNSGSGAAHNNQQQFITVYIYKRTA